MRRGLVAVVAVFTWLTYNYYKQRPRNEDEFFQVLPCTRCRHALRLPEEEEGFRSLAQKCQEEEEEEVIACFPPVDDKKEGSFSCSLLKLSSPNDTLGADYNRLFG